MKKFKIASSVLFSAVILTIFFGSPLWAEEKPENEEGYIKVIYNREGEVLGVEPLKGGKIIYENQPLRDNPIENVFRTSFTEIILGGKDMKDDEGKCMWVYHGGHLWLTCW